MHTDSLSMTSRVFGRHGGRRIRALLLAAASTAVMLGAAQAQSSDGLLDPISVEGERGAIQGYVAKRATTATKTSTPLNETPQAVSVVSDEQIRDQKPTKLDEIVRYSPGVKGETFGADPRNDWFLLRGFTSQNEAIFLDGMQLFYTSFGSWKLQPFALDRLEILRGPSSVLYGGGSPGGVINAVSKKPTVEPLRYLEFGVNNFGNRYFAFDLGGPVAMPPQNGELFYRVTGMAKAGDTQVDYTEDDNYFIAPSVTWKPNADTTLTILASASKNTTNSLNFLPYVGTVTPAPFGRISTSTFTGEPASDRFRREQAMIGYQFERHLTDSVTFRQNARYAHLDVLFSSVYGADYANMATADLARYDFLTTAKAAQANLDNQLEIRGTTGPLQHTVLFGIDLKHYKLDDYQAFGFGTPINLVNPVYSGTPQYAGGPYQDRLLTQEQAGFYLQDQIKFDRWTLVLSGRNDFVHNDNDNRIGVGQSSSDSRPTGRAGLIYTSEIGLSPYISYATSYNPVIGTNSTTGQWLTPETGKQAEIGVKYQPTGVNGHIGVALFDLRRQNVVTTDPISQVSSQTGEVTSRGLELEVVANPAPGLKLVGAYTTYNIKVTKDLNPANIDTVPTATPREFGSLWFDYTLQSGLLQGFGFGGGVRYIGESFADTANTLTVPAVTLGDAAIHYERDKWRLALNVSNIADTTYVASCSSSAACFYGDRRRATLSIAYKW